MKIDNLIKKNNIVILTCYDSSFAGWLERNKCDALLVGDSLGIYIKGGNSTKSTIIADIIYHTKAVKSGVKSIPIISDMPFGSYSSKRLAKKNALKLIEAGADMIKIEGSKDVYEIVNYLASYNINVCGHIGYTPQTEDQPLKKYHNTDLLAQAKSLEACGAKMIVLSMTGDEADELITNNLNIPTISFRSSFKCNGSVEILHDLLGISNNAYVFKKPNIKNNNISLQALLQNFIQNIKES
tara:strand:+ start:5216 stop:5938 length:723 start_codon:yes stop_codon:yes gene_type:complete